MTRRASSGAAMLCFTSQLNELELKLLNAVYEEFSRHTTEKSRKKQEVSSQLTRNLRVQVLQLLGRDSTDWHDLDVGTIKAAVKAAYPPLYLAVGKQVFGQYKVNNTLTYYCQGYLL
jgi:hypothetical protein